MTTSSPCILLVDDDPAVLQAYARALRQSAPLLAEDGIAARKILTETEVDVVVCDLDMPRMNGVELMQWAKEHCPRPLWIVATGQNTFDAAVQALKLGAFDFISKPLQTILELQVAVGNAARQQALVGEKARLMRSLADNNLRLSEHHRKLEAANGVLREQQQMLEQDLKRAERIVRALLPQSLSAIEKMQVNVSYRPSHSIGGDFYGAAMLDARHLVVYIADAAGHGVSAALLAVLFNQRLALLKTRGLPIPAEILGELNRGLLEECRASGLFVTAVFALIDVEARTATLASAGHPPCILLRRNGASEHLDKTGPALGLTPEATYGEHQLSLSEGDRLFLYTDGLTDAIPETAPSLETILTAVTATVNDEANVIDHLLTWTEHGERYDDDMTIVLVTASPAVAKPIAATPRKPDCTLATGSEESTTWVAIRGRTNWKDAARLREVCIEALDAGQSLIIELSSCIMLDSTMLGTLHEMVLRAAPDRLQLQSVGDKIRALFDELAMSQVIQTITLVTRPIPETLTELGPTEAPIPGNLILRAHELLAGLSPSNAEQFQPVVDSLREADDPKHTRH
jgi:sigma-B regulation protein RsbU (phosphoserine phosphatase)